VDPSEGQTALQALLSWGWTLDYILNTHHHQDHVGGNTLLKQHFTKLAIVASREAVVQGRIPGADLDNSVDEKQKNPLILSRSKLQFSIFNIPGHTRDHIAFYLPTERALFCGDTLFSLGCGRLFEGSPSDMYQSLAKLSILPANTWVYCAHEYTLANGQFALTMEGKNEQLVKYLSECKEKISQGLSTVPSLLSVELATNPFLRVTNNIALRRVLTLADDANDITTFAALRKAKDLFKPL